MRHLTGGNWLTFSPAFARQAAFVFLLSFLLFTHLLLSYLPATQVRNLTILGVGDTKSDDGFAPDVREAIESEAIARYGQSQQNPEITVLWLETSSFLSDSGSLQHPTKLTNALYRAVSEHKVSAVIDASTTNVSPVVVESCTHLGVPVVLTVATNELVLSHGHGLAFRIPANDAVQARKIVSWAQDYNVVIVVHDSTQYAKALYHRLASAAPANSSPFLVYPLSEENSVIDAVQSVLSIKQEMTRSRIDGRDEGTVAIVYLGYPQKAKELMRACSIFLPETDILMSDGSYSRNMQAVEAKSTRLFITFPVDISVENHKSGFGPLGRDAFLLTCTALAIQGRSLSKDDGFSSSIRAATKTSSTLGVSNIAFDPNGENLGADFHLVPVLME